MDHLPSTPDLIPDDLMRKLEAIAGTHKRIAHDPRNWFTDEEDANPWPRRGVLPMDAMKPGVPGFEIETEVFSLLTHRENDTTFAYVVMAPTDKQPEPVRRLRIWRNARGEITAEQAGRNKDLLFTVSGIGILASCWFGDLPDEVAVGLRVAAVQKGRTYTRTPILWDIQLTHTTLTVPRGTRPLLDVGGIMANRE